MTEPEKQVAAIQDEIETLTSLPALVIPDAAELTQERFDIAMKIAGVFARSEIVPKHFRGKPESCFIALHLAQQLGEHPLMIMQNMFDVHGTPGWKTSYMIARANRSGVFQKQITWTWEGAGEKLVVTAHATLSNGQQIHEPVSLQMATREGWAKQNPKYQSMPYHMLCYRSAAFLIRKYCPQVMLGYQTAEELEDVKPDRGGPERILTIGALTGEMPPVEIVDDGAQQDASAPTSAA